MSILRLFEAFDDDHAAHRSRRARPNVQVWRACSLSLCWLGSCTSFAALDDSPTPSETGNPSPASNGAGGGALTPEPEPARPGPITGDLPGVSAGDEPIDTPPVTGPRPEPSRDAGAPPDPVDTDAGLPDQDLPPQPGTVEVPVCMDGMALTLDGATYATVPRAVENDFTIEAWIKTSVSPMGAGAFNGRRLFDSDIIGMGPRDDFAVSLINERIAFGVGNPDTSVQGVGIVTTGQWEHVAVTRRATNGQLQVIIDGELQAVGFAANLNPLSARPDLAFGGFAPMNKFIGAIDEVKFWNVVRSVQDIAASMRERPTGSEQGLVGYYSFEDQGSVQTADASPLGLDATVLGNVAYEASSALCPRAP